MTEPRIVPPKEAREVLASIFIQSTARSRRRVTALDRDLAHTAVVLGEQRDAVLALVRPYLGEPDGYQHYAVQLDDGVHLAVLLEDLRRVLGEDE